MLTIFGLHTILGTARLDLPIPPLWVHEPAFRDAPKEGQHSARFSHARFCGARRSVSWIFWMRFAQSNLELHSFACWHIAGCQGLALDSTYTLVRLVYRNSVTLVQSDTKEGQHSARFSHARFCGARRSVSWIFWMRFAQSNLELHSFACWHISGCQGLALDSTYTLVRLVYQNSVTLVQSDMRPPTKSARSGHQLSQLSTLSRFQFHCRNLAWGSRSSNAVMQKQYICCEEVIRTGLSRSLACMWNLRGTWPTWHEVRVLRMRSCKSSIYAAKRWSEQGWVGPWHACGICGVHDAFARVWTLGQRQLCFCCFCDIAFWSFW
jgi:hypothetical protein